MTIATWEYVDDMVRGAEITCEGTIPVGASVKQIEAFERRIGLTLPPTYKNWLSRFNGAPIGPGGIYGVDCPYMYWDLESNQNADKPRICRTGWLEIAGDGCGNSYVLAAKGGFDLLEPIFFQQALFHRSEHKATFIAASNMLAFVAGLLLREMEVFHWPFDREKTLQLDPEIGIARGIQFPWDA